MRLALLAHGIATTDGARDLERLPELRKATPAMLHVAAALTDLGKLSPPTSWTQWGPSLGVVLGTGHGELEPTIQFLRELGASGTARPFLFQNSLHNATLGFTSQRYNLRGPGLTVSRRYFSGEDALDAADDLLHARGITHVLVIGVDCVPIGLESALTETYPPGTMLRSGAAALLVARPETAPGVPVLEGIEYLSPTAAPAPLMRPCYDADAIETLAAALRRSPVPGSLDLHKPDGSGTRLRLAT